MSRPRKSYPESRDTVQRLFIAHMDQLRGYLTPLVPDFQLVDDLVQETFVVVTARAATYSPKTSFTEWMYGIAREKLAALGSRDGQDSRLFSQDVLDVLLASRREAAEPPAATRALEECIERLAPQARRIIDLRYVQAMKPREVARMLGLTAGSVRVALCRARASLRECVERKVIALNDM